MSRNRSKQSQKRPRAATPDTEDEARELHPGMEENFGEMLNPETNAKLEREWKAFCDQIFHQLEESAEVDVNELENEILTKKDSQKMNIQTKIDQIQNEIATARQAELPTLYKQIEGMKKMRQKLVSLLQKYDQLLQNRGNKAPRIESVITSMKETRQQEAQVFKKELLEAELETQPPELSETTDIRTKAAASGKGNRRNAKSGKSTVVSNTSAAAVANSSSNKQQQQQSRRR